MADPVSNLSVPVDFDQMMRETGPRLYTLAVRLTGNPVDGQDLAQETYVKAFKHWNGFRRESEAQTWLYRICVNCWKNRVRYETRRSFWRHDSLDAAAGDEGPARELPEQVPALSQRLERTDIQRLVQRGLQKLEPAERAILVLRDMEDRPYEEIAVLLDLPLGTVKSRLSRGRERLRALLEAERTEIGR